MKPRDINIYVPFQKVDDELRMVYGYCTSESKDSQGEIVKGAAIRKAWDAYMEYANVREMHQPSAVGVTKEYSHDNQGTFIGVKVVDDIAWTKVKEGVYKGFSIGGRVLKKTKNIIDEIILAEISLVDRPANPDAKFSAIKVDGGLVDRLEQDSINSKIMKKFVELNGVKYEEDPAKPGEVLVDEHGDKVLFVEETVEEPVVDTPVVEETPVVEPVVEEPVVDEPEVVEQAAQPFNLKKFKTPTTAKDSMGVISLASLLDHACYLESMFEMNGKETSGITKAIETIKSMIAVEAGESDSGEKSAQTEDLAKVFGEQLSKALEPFMEKVGGLETKIDSVVNDVEMIKNTKVSPRPKVSAAVEKVIQTEPGKVTSGTIAEKRKALEVASAAIDEHSLFMKGISNPSDMNVAMAKSDKLFTDYRTAQRELNDVLAGVSA